MGGFKNMLSMQGQILINIKSTYCPYSKWNKLINNTYSNTSCSKLYALAAFKYRNSPWSLSFVITGTNFVSP